MPARGEPSTQSRIRQTHSNAFISFRFHNKTRQRVKNLRMNTNVDIAIDNYMASLVGAVMRKIQKIFGMV